MSNLPIIVDMNTSPKSSPEFRQFKKLLKTNGHFLTKPRTLLFGILQHHTTLSIQQLIKQLDKHDQATVYRNIELFEKLGIINRLRLGWKSKLELSDMFKHHHHHLTCLHCGKVIVLKDDKLIEKEIAKIGRSLAFKITDHQLEIRGLCKSCQKLV